MLVNPSNQGWIEKLIKEVSFHESFNFENHHTFYQSVYESGYLYGYTQSINCFFNLDVSELFFKIWYYLLLCIICYFSNVSTEYQIKRKNKIQARYMPHRYCCSYIAIPSLRLF